MAFDGVAALDLTGPLEALSIARFPGGRGEALPCYRPVVMGLERRSFTSESGLIFKAEACAESSDSFDTILIPGGSGLRQPETIRRVAGWLAARANSTRRIASVSTGLYALAQSGLVDGRPVATHWRFSRDIARRFPRLRVTHTASFLKDDRFYTSAGGTAGVEMTLALIEEDCGGEVARAAVQQDITGRQVVRVEAIRHGRASRTRCPERPRAIGTPRIGSRSTQPAAKWRASQVPR